LIKVLQKYHEDKIVVLSDGIGWANIEDVIETDSDITLTSADHPENRWDKD
tara:strand:+ start:21 stop:173 length:153 start_codon:yes stop_codon:yes gene_type:complete